MNKELRQYLESLGLRSDATTKEAWQYFASLDGDQKSRAEALRDGKDPDAATEQTNRSEPKGGQGAGEQTQPSEQPGAGEETQRFDAAAELQRRDAIEDLAERFDLSDDMKRTAIRKGWSVDQLKDKALEAKEHDRGEPVVAGTGDGSRPGFSVAPYGFSRTEPEQNNQMLSGALLIGSLDRSEVVPTLQTMVGGTFDSEQTKQRAEQIANQADDLGPMLPTDICRAALALNNHRVPSGHEDMVRAAIATGSLSNVMEPSLNARMMRAFREGEDMTDRFTSETDVRDFRQNERHSIGKQGTPAKRHRYEAARSGTISDRAPETYKVFEYADTRFIDEQDIVDDRLDVFDRMPMEMGMAFRRLKRELVYFILLNNANMADGNALFDSANHSNDSDLALDKTNLESVIKKMRTQQKDGVNLNVMPRTIIAAEELGFTAEELLSSQRLITRGNTDDTLGNFNALSRMGMEVVPSPELSNGVTDPDSGTTAAGSSTTWFLAANPTQVPVIEVAYIAGRGRNPRTNTRRLAGENSQYGIEYSAQHAIGAKALDWVGLQKGND